jgi:hypothetical protein
MPQRPRSLKHEYELYVEEEIENYKESIPRSAILAIGDEAAARLQEHAQISLTELLLWEEVDRIIFKRLRLPAYQTWRRRRIKLLAELQRPEHWGLHPDDAVVRAVRQGVEGRVLVAGDAVDGPALYLAANGCEVTALDPQGDALERVMGQAEQAGIATRIHGCVGDLRSWVPEQPLTAVLCATEAFAGLSREERGRVIAVLQSATLDGGVHLVRTIAAGRQALTLDELRTRYAGWDVTVEPGSAGKTFLARKAIS